MVVIRLARCGSKHRPTYRVVVADSRKSATGRFIEIIGHYNSLDSDKKKAFSLNVDKYKSRLSEGVKPSRTVRNLAKKVYSL